MVKSSPGSLLPVRNRMTGWPTFLLWRSTSSTKPGWWCVPKLRLKISMQVKPHDGVAALAVPAVSAPTVLTPPTRVSVAAAAKTLLLIDMDSSSLEPQPCPAHGTLTYHHVSCLLAGRTGRPHGCRPDMAVAPAPQGADATVSIRVGTKDFLLEDSEVGAPELGVDHGADDRAEAVGEA